MLFQDRTDAGRQLARHLTPYADRDDTLVLGVPRGGVPVAFEVAAALHAPFDVFVARKLGAPADPELAFGAVSADGERYLDYGTVHALGITPRQVNEITADARARLDQRARLYRSGRDPLPAAGKIVILVNDGISADPGFPLILRALRERKPRRIIVASPVAPAPTCSRLQREADAVIVLHSPAELTSLGHFYRTFDQTTDDEVISLLQRGLDTRPPRRLEEPVAIAMPGYIAEGYLRLPPGARTLVLFANAAETGRIHPRHREMAALLNRWGIATLLFDLLSPFEEDNRRGASLVDRSVLAARILRVIDWAQRNPATSGLRIALFGSDAAASACLSAAVRAPEALTAVVASGGRPHARIGELAQIRVPTLLIGDSLDELGLALHREALRNLTCAKELAVMPGAAHSSEEPGALQRVAERAADWINRASNAGSPLTMRRPPLPVRPEKRALAS